MKKYLVMLLVFLAMGCVVEQEEEQEYYEVVCENDWYLVTYKNSQSLIKEVDWDDGYCPNQCNPQKVATLKELFPCE